MDMHLEARRGPSIGRLRKVLILKTSVSLLSSRRGPRIRRCARTKVGGRAKRKFLLSVGPLKET